MRTEAYVDTSALIAFMDRTDAHHAAFRSLFADPPPLVTTPLVIAEGHAWFLRRFDRALALRFLALVEDLAPLTVVPVGPAEQAAATELLRRFADQDLTIADAVGLHVMRARRVSACWSTDRHLGLTGVPLAVRER
ncbi:MAG: type II toxin-antitoxin system VapC family toxin [Actinobacteria bacterium]|nr:MAG: type II toxin-antitoxin system VapC family toxin [Actinomycetota bacterium]